AERHRHAASALDVSAQCDAVGSVGQYAAASLSIASTVTTVSASLRAARAVIGASAMCEAGANISAPAFAHLAHGAELTCSPNAIRSVKGALVAGATAVSDWAAVRAVVVEVFASASSLARPVSLR